MDGLVGTAEAWKLLIKVFANIEIVDILKFLQLQL